MSAARFSYSVKESQALANEVPLPGATAELNLWSRAHRCRPLGQADDWGSGDPTKLRTVMGRRITLQLSLAAGACIDQIGKGAKGGRRPASQDLEIIRRIAKDAKRLQKDLNSPNLLPGSFALLLELSDPNETSRMLREIVARAALAEEMSALIHSADEFASHHAPDLLYFVSAAVRCWEWWSGCPAGRGKTGSPAARFLCRAVNPLLNFTEKEMGITLRRGGVIDDAAAGKLIEAVASADNTAVKGKTGK